MINLYYPLVIVLYVVSALWQGNLGTGELDRSSTDLSACGRAQPHSAPGLHGLLSPR